jgi:hypothetical protein
MWGISSTPIALVATVVTTALAAVGFLRIVNLGQALEATDGDALPGHHLHPNTGEQIHPEALQARYRRVIRSQATHRLYRCTVHNSSTAQHAVGTQKKEYRLVSSSTMVPHTLLDVL